MLRLGHTVFEFVHFAQLRLRFAFKLDIFELLILPAVALIVLESVFRLSLHYRNYVLRYEKIYTE